MGRDLTDIEQRRVRTALRFLRLRVGGWEPLARGLGYEYDTVEKMVNGRRAVTAVLALRVARFADASLDEILAGQWISPRTCPHCGHPPEDFGDEETVAEISTRPASGRGDRLRAHRRSSSTCAASATARR